jgi:hypothetical protein
MLGVMVGPLTTIWEEEEEDDDEGCTGGMLESAFQWLILADRGVDVKALDERSKVKIRELMLERDRRVVPWKPALLCICFSGLVVLDVLRGGKGKSPIGAWLLGRPCHVQCLVSCCACSAPGCV